MGEAVAGLAGKAPGRWLRREVEGFGFGPWVGAPGGSWQFEHAAEQALGGAAAEEEGAGGVLQPEMGAEAGGAGFLGKFAGQVGGGAGAAGPAGVAPGAEGAGGGARGADGGAEVEERLGEVGGTGGGGGVMAEGAGGSGDFGAGGGEGAVDGEDAGGDALDVAVDGHDGDGEGDAGDGGGGVVADAWEGLEAGQVGGEGAVGGDEGGGAVQVAGAGVVAEACPGLQHGVLGGLGEGGNGGKAGEEALEVGTDGGDGGLLEHDLRQPDAVWVGRLAGGGAPWHRAAVAVVPIQEGVCRRDGRHKAGMASGDGSRKDEARMGGVGRFYGGPRSIGALLPAVTRPAFRARSAGAAQLLADWTAIIGPALAAVTQPRRLTGGTLTLACSGPIALELQHLTGQLAERINGHFGRVMVERFRFVQDPGVAGVAAPPRRKAAPVPVEVPGLAPGGLRDALAALGGRVAQGRAGRS